MTITLNITKKKVLISTAILSLIGVLALSLGLGLGLGSSKQAQNLIEENNLEIVPFANGDSEEGEIGMQATWTSQKFINKSYPIQIYAKNLTSAKLNTQESTYKVEDNRFWTLKVPLAKTVTPTLNTTETPLEFETDKTTDLPIKSNSANNVGTYIYTEDGPYNNDTYNLDIAAYLGVKLTLVNDELNPYDYELSFTYSTLIYFNTEEDDYIFDITTVQSIFKYESDFVLKSFITNSFSFYYELGQKNNKKN